MAGRVPASWADDIRVFNAQRVVVSPIRFYCLSLGFWQYWDMFAPNPSDTDIWVDAIVTYRDGSTYVYPYPRMADLPIFQKYFKERYRKFYERVNPDTQEYMWPRFAEHIAEMCNTKPNDPPVMVVLRRHFKKIAPPGEPQPKDYTAYEYYRYVVDPSDLDKAADQ